MTTVVGAAKPVQVGRAGWVSAGDGPSFAPSFPATSLLCSLVVTYPIGYALVHHGCGIAGTGGPEPAHGARDPPQSPGDGRRARGGPSDRPPGSVPSSTRAAGGRTGRRPSGRAAPHLHPATRGICRGGRVAGAVPGALAEPARSPAHGDRPRKEGAKMKIIGTMRSLDRTRGAVRVEDMYDTDIDDLWEACTNPERLARWIAKVSGDLRVGGSIHAVFTSTWTGPGRIDACEKPHHLLLTTEPGTSDEAQIEAWLTEEDSRARLVVQDRGLPLERLY